MFISAAFINKLHLRLALFLCATICSAFFTVSLHAQTAGAVAVFNVLEDGQVASPWNADINAFDSAINYGECNNDGGAGCPSISWAVVSDSERGSDGVNFFIIFYITINMLICRIVSVSTKFYMDSNFDYIDGRERRFGILTSWNMINRYP